MKILLADDEVAARSRLRRLLKGQPDLTILGEARNGVETVEKVEKLRPDLLFLDIEMPGLNGLEALRSIPPEVPLPLVIFVTGYDQHALAAFEAHALAYLLKPIDPAHLGPALERARKLQVNAHTRASEQDNLREAVRSVSRPLPQIVGRKHDRLVLLPPAQVVWFEVQDSIVKAHTATESFWVNHTLGELEGGLPADMFFRARREALVNLRSIREIRPYFKSGFLLQMADHANAEIVVSERRVPALRTSVPGL